MGNRIMLFQSVYKFIFFLLISLLLLSCGNEEPADKAAVVPAQHAEGVVADVGGEQITFNELNLMLNSSAMVGLSIPALGTPERNQVIITLLDKMISANLLYLDAKRNGADRLTKYIDDMKKNLNEKESTILTARLLGDEPLTLQDIADQFGISRERVRQIEVGLLKKMRKYLEQEVPDIKDFLEDAFENWRT